MKTFITILIVLVTASCSAQDSVRLKVERIRTAEGKYIIWMKDEQTKNRYITICNCGKLPEDVKKGNTITVPAAHMQVIKEVFTKRDLEN